MGLYGLQRPPGQAFHWGWSGTGEAGDGDAGKQNGDPLRSGRGNGGVSGSSEDRTGGRVKRGRMPDIGKGFSYADVRNGRRNVSKNHGRAFLLFLYYICNSSEHQRNENSDYANLFAIG